MISDAEFRRLAALLQPHEIVAEFIALCVVESTYTPELSITVELGEADAVITDSGRGMQLAPDPGDHISHAERALTGYYPCLPANDETDGLLRRAIWGDRGSFGPGFPNAACPQLRFTSRRNSEAWTQSYRFGVPDGPPVQAGTTDETGTTISLVTSDPIDKEAVAEFVAVLSSGFPQLRLELLLR